MADMALPSHDPAADQRERVFVTNVFSMANLFGQGQKPLVRATPLKTDQARALVAGKRVVALIGLHSLHQVLKVGPRGEQVIVTLAPPDVPDVYSRDLECDIHANAKEVPVPLQPGSQILLGELMIVERKPSLLRVNAIGKPKPNAVVDWTLIEVLEETLTVESDS
jgi:hypothetical protein